MSLFDKLRDLCRGDRFRLEDFHTEIVAQALRDSPKLTLAWLRSLEMTQLPDAAEITVVTQEGFEALDGHATGSRPDLAIRLRHGDDSELILIESKVGAKEGPNQLERYAAHLASHPSAQRTGLVFITRDFELDRAFPPDTAKFTFRRTRWRDFFIILKTHLNDDGLARQLVSFMEENKMSVRNQLTAVDCVALENFLGARNLMRETLWGDVSNDFASKLGKASTPAKAMSQLRGQNRYVLITGFGKQYDFQCILGYWLPEDAPGDTVWVGVVLDCNPKSPARSKIHAAFKAFAEKRGGAWELDVPDDPRYWGNVCCGVGLPTFLGKPDHLQAVRTYFLERLAEVSEFKAEHPDLPWVANTGETEEE